MNKIYFASNWGMSSEELLSFYKRQTPNNNGTWEDLIGTTNIDEADYIIVQDDTSEPVNKNKVIFFGREPDHVLPRHVSLKWKDCYGFFHHEFGTAWLPQTWWVDINYDSIGDIPSDKQLDFSIIDSGNTYLYGHKQRVNFINKLISQHPDKVDVWGKITYGKENVPPYKTPLPKRAKEDALIPYRYSLAIENGRTDYYFSEKLIDPIMCWSMPIYYGCNNISKFLPEGSYINIDINSSSAVEEVMDIIASDIREKNIENIKEARHLILTKYNIWPTIKRAIENNR